MSVDNLRINYYFSKLWRSLSVQKPDVVAVMDKVTGPKRRTPIGRQFIHN